MNVYIIFYTMKKAPVLIALLLAGVSLSAQSKYLTREGYVKFYSHTPIEDIEADLSNAASIIDSESGEVIITMQMEDFSFEKKLMQEHFNENYMESEKYPKASFKGTIVNNSDVDYAADGTYNVLVKGDMTIHGVTNAMETYGTLEVKGASIIARTAFIVKPADYKIIIPKIVREKIAKEVEVTAELKYAVME